MRHNSQFPAVSIFSPPRSERKFRQAVHSHSRSLSLPKTDSFVSVIIGRLGSVHCEPQKGIKYIEEGDKPKTLFLLVIFLYIIIYIVGGALDYHVAPILMGCYYVKEYKFARSLLVVTLGKLYRVALFLYSVTAC